MENLSPPFYFLHVANRKKPIMGSGEACRALADYISSEEPKQLWLLKTRFFDITLKRQQETI